MASWVRRAARVAVLGLLVYAGLCAAMFVFQRSLQYRPDAAPMQPAAAGLTQVEQETLRTPDGEQLVAWWSPPRDANQPVYLYLHGNGANLLARARRIERLIQGGAGVLALSWRGYGGSSGSPSETGLRTDARTAYDTLARRVAPSRIVIYGESIGTTVAVMLAAEVPAAALVLDSAFSSALAVAESAYPWLPVRWLLRDPLRADLAAPRVAMPVLQVHCRDDPVTPLAFAHTLNALMPRAEPLIVLDKRCHVPTLLDYESALAGFVQRVLPAR